MANYNLTNITIIKKNKYFCFLTYETICLFLSTTKDYIYKEVKLSHVQSITTNESLKCNI